MTFDDWGKWPVAMGLDAEMLSFKTIVISCFLSTAFFLHLPPSLFSRVLLFYALLSFILQPQSTSKINIFPPYRHRINHHTTFLIPHTSYLTSTSNPSRFVRKAFQDGCRRILCKSRWEFLSPSFPLVSSLTASDLFTCSIQSYWRKREIQKALHLSNRIPAFSRPI